MLYKFVGLTAIAVILSACASDNNSSGGQAGGGSGGGGPSPTPDPITGTVVTNGTAVLTHLTGITMNANDEVASFTVSDTSGNSGNAIVVTETETEAAVDFTGALTGGEVLVDQANILSVATRHYENAGEDPFLQITLAGNDSVLGEVSYETATGLVYGYFHGGTAATNVPTTGTATYTGYAQASGVHINADDPADNGDIEMINGVASIAVDFGAGTLSGVLNDFENADDGSTSDIDINIDGAVISGSSYSGGTITITESGSGTSLMTGIASQFNGAFYGDGAPETAGAFQMTGSLTDEAGGGSVFIAGGFRADQ